MCTTTRMQALAAAAAILLASPAWAGTLLDPATLHIGPGANTSCATGGCPIFIGGSLNGEVNNIADPTRLDIYQNSNGAPALENPVLLILSVPNTSNTSIGPSPVSASLYAPYDASSDTNSGSTSVTITTGTSAYGIATNAAGFAAFMTSSDVYSILGISHADASNSFQNYSAAYLRTLGTPVSNFGIYVFSIDTTAFAGNDLLDITLGSSLPEGTFAVAYGQDSNNNKLYDTPFTEAGMVDQPPPVEVPEPASLSMFGAALVALGLMQWRRRGRSLV